MKWRAVDYVGELTSAKFPNFCLPPPRTWKENGPTFSTNTASPGPYFTYYIVSTLHIALERVV